MTKFRWWSMGATLLLACSGASEGEQPPGQADVDGSAQVPLPELARSSVAYDAAPSVDPGTEAALVDDLNNFGLAVFQHLAPSAQNFVVSPVSGFIALTMTSAGARGVTLDQMKAVLYPNVSLDQIHPATNRLGQRIRGYARPPAQTAAGEKKVEVNLANADFVQKGYAIEQPFLDTLAANYDSGVALVDYLHDPEAARVLINNWVAKETKDRIEDLIPSGGVDSWTVLVLVNALYLYSSWLTAFDPNATHARTFHGVNADSSTDFMNAGLDLGYTTGAGWVAVDVPYYGNSLVLTAVLPDAGQFDAVKASLNAPWFASFDAASRSQLVALSIPKFKFSGETVEWKPTLQALGMTDLFDQGIGDLRGISSTDPPYVSGVLQQVFVELAEKGTEAAAATAVVGTAGSSAGPPPPPPLSVVLDRPFLFVIRERGGPMLFAGQIVDLPPG